MARPARLSAVRATPLLGAGLLVALVAAPALAGEVYKWKDAQGVTHYSDAPPASISRLARAMEHCLLSRVGAWAAAGLAGIPGRCRISRLS